MFWRRWRETVARMREVRLLRAAARGQLRLDELPGHLQEEIRAAWARRWLRRPGSRD